MKHKLLIFCIAFCLNIYASNKLNYRNIVFEGGGIKGLAFSGVLIELEKRGLLDSIVRVGGTSSGAISATLYAIGYTPEEIKDISYNIKIKQFNDGGYLYIGGFIRLVSKFGIYKGDKIEKYISDLIQKKTGNANITFKDLRDNDNYLDLHITATNMNKQKAEYFSYENYPNMKVSDALRATISIPFYLKPVWINEYGEVIKNPKNKSNLNVYVDGGLAANFPIDIFDDFKYLLDTNKYIIANCNKFINYETLGIMLESGEQFRNKQNFGYVTKPINKLEDFIIAYYSISLGMAYDNLISKDDLKRIIIVNTENISPKIRKISASDKEKLIDSGTEGVVEFIRYINQD